MPNALVRLPELKIDPREQRVDFGPINNAIDDYRKRKEFEAQQQLRERQLGIQERQAATQDEDRQKQAIGGVVQSIDQLPDGPQRQQAWGKFVASQPHYAKTLQQYGQDPADFRNGPKFILSQIRGPVDPLEQQERQARIDASRAQTDLTRASTTNTQSQMAERQANVAREMGFYLNANGELSYDPKLVPTSFSPGGTRPGGATSVPAVPVQGRETREQARDRTVRELGPTVRGPQQQQSQEQAPSEADVQRYWSAVYGQKPPSGQKYGRDGALINMKGSANDKTRDAIKGALSSAQGNIDDVREALRNTNMVTRGLGLLDPTGSSTMQRAVGPLRIAIRGVLHGISGAQINIPEQKEYFDTMLPSWRDSASTIEYKLSHLENTLAHIRKFSEGSLSDDDVMAARNAMREGLGLKKIDAQAARKRLDDRGKGGQGGGWSIKKLPD